MHGQQKGTSMKRHSKRPVSYLLIIGITLAACGGGGGNNIPTPSTRTAELQSTSILSPRRTAELQSTIELTPFEVCGEDESKVTDGTSAGACARSLVPGMQRFWLERSSVADQTSRLKYISFGTLDWSSEPTIQFGVDHFSFLKAQRLGEFYDDYYDSVPISASSNDVIDINEGYEGAEAHKIIFDFITPELLNQVGAVIVTNANRVHNREAGLAAATTGLMLIVAAPLYEKILLNPNGPKWEILPDFAGECFLAPEYCVVVSSLIKRGVHSTIVCGIAGQCALFVASNDKPANGAISALLRSADQ